MKFGLEIEFYTDKIALFNKLDELGIPYKYIPRPGKLVLTDKLLFKNECTLRNDNGIEVNFPPVNNFEEIQDYILGIASIPYSFDERCALHVHYDFSDHSSDDLDKIHNYYSTHQDEIKSAAKEKGVYVNLNRDLVYGEYRRKGRLFNINLYRSFDKHRTIEHRIYKSTFNLDKIRFCVEQTRDIIEKALSEI